MGWRNIDSLSPHRAHNQFKREPLFDSNVTSLRFRADFFSSLLGAVSSGGALRHPKGAKAAADALSPLGTPRQMGFSIAVSHVPNGLAGFAVAVVVEVPELLSGDAIV